MSILLTCVEEILCVSLDLYCTLEVDSFGIFVNKAKTRVYRYTTEPKWNEVHPTNPVPVRKALR